MSRASTRNVLAILLAVSGFVRYRGFAIDSRSDPSPKGPATARAWPRVSDTTRTRSLCHSSLHLAFRLDIHEVVIAQGPFQKTNDHDGTPQRVEIVIECATMSSIDKAVTGLPDDTN